MENKKIIEPNDRNIRELLDTKKYSIDVFQREYQWERKHIEQLINDLTQKFLSYYKEEDEREKVGQYGKYYLGSIVTCQNNNNKSIIDGQQRLTSLTLLLIHLNHLQKNNDENTKVNINDLIFSEKYSKKSYNLEIENRKECMDSLFNKGEYNMTENDSTNNIVNRYEDIKEIFPDELEKKALPYFIEWLIYNVVIVEITTYTDEDAYTIFETMNDRGLNLTAAEMLKGYLLSKLDSDEEKNKLNELWKEKIEKINKFGKNQDLEFFKCWFRAKYATTIRKGKKGSENEDFEKIGTRFHTWLRDEKEKIGLKGSKTYFNFIKEDFVFYSNLYCKILKGLEKKNINYEHIYYLGEREFTLSPILLMAPIKRNDDEETINKKLNIVSKYLEMYIVIRSLNYKSLGHSSVRYTMYNLTKEIRDKSVNELIKIFKEKINTMEEKMEGIEKLSLHGQNKKFIKFLLARITAYIEEGSYDKSNFEKYVKKSKKPFEIEHIWNDNYEDYKEEFTQRDEWEKYRNNIGALLLIENGFNQSFGSDPYSKKVEQYFGHNILAKSLNKKCYENNPGFNKFIKDTKLPFKSYEQFNKKSIEERNKLYLEICKKIYDIKEFDTLIE